MTRWKTQNQIDSPNQKGCRNESGKIGKKYKKTGSEKIETVGDFSVIVNPYLWKLLKTDDNDFIVQNKMLSMFLQSFSV